MKAQVSSDTSHSIYIKILIKSVSSLIVFALLQAMVGLCHILVCNSMCMLVLGCLKRCFECVIKGCSQELGCLALNCIVFMIF